MQIKACGPNKQSDSYLENWDSESQACAIKTQNLWLWKNGQARKSLFLYIIMWVTLRLGESTESFGILWKHENFVLIKIEKHNLITLHKHWRTKFKSNSNSNFETNSDHWHAYSCVCDVVTCMYTAARTGTRIDTDTRTKCIDSSHNDIIKAMQTGVCICLLMYALLERAYIHACIHTYIHMYIHIHIYICMHTCILRGTHLCTHIYILVHIKYASIWVIWTCSKQCFYLPWNIMCQR
jgi:hypothetical protein